MRTTILKNIILTIFMAGAGIGTVMIGTKIERLSENTDYSVIVQAASNSSSSRGHRSSGGARISSGTRASSMDAMPTISTPATHSAVASSASRTSVGITATPVAGGMSANSFSSSNSHATASNGGGAGGGSSLESSTRMLASASSGMRSNSAGTAAISAPFSDSRPSSTVHTRSLDGDDGEDKPSEPEHPFVNPIGDFPVVLLFLLVAGYSLLIYRRKKTTKC